MQESLKRARPVTHVARGQGRARSVDPAGVDEQRGGRAGLAQHRQRALEGTGVAVVEGDHRGAREVAAAALESPWRATNAAPKVAVKANSSRRPISE